VAVGVDAPESLALVDAPVPVLDELLPESDGLAGALESVSGADADTLTTRETEPVLPLESVAVYVTVYMPAVFVVTVPLTTIELEISAPLASVAVAPGSVNTPP
jgi:hypothetical protein